MLSHSTPVAPPVSDKSADKSTKDTAPPDKAVQCPKCLAVFPESQLLTPAPPAEYPKMLYKLVPKPKPPSPDEPEEELQTVVVQNEEEQKKDESEGWQKDVPQPKDAKADTKHEQAKHEESKTKK